MRITLDLKLALLMYGMMLLAAAAAVIALLYFKSAPYPLLITAAVVLVPAVLAARRAVAPVHRVLRGHADQRGVLHRRGLQRVAGRQSPR